MLVEEVARRTGIRWNTAHAWPEDDTPVIALGTMGRRTEFAGPHLGVLETGPLTKSPEGFHIRTVRRQPSPALLLAGNDARGVLFGVGRLLRSLRMERGKITLAKALNLSSAPRYRLRGHQLGYRPKTNSYDGWDVPMWKQYIRDLAVFGTNAIELIPPRSDDDPDSPHFPLPPMRMMIEMSRLAAQHGLEVWIWYPALDRDYSDPATIEFALKEWGEVFRQLPHIDAVFVPGGDPGHTRPRYLMGLLEKQASNLRRYHPRAQMWVSPQGFDKEWMEEFLELLRQEPAWLTGIVFGPQNRLSLPELRRVTPKRYPIRFYPDITHTLHAQFPVPDWDVAYALTLGREPINPRPVDQAHIFRLLQPHADIGFLTYSEGCNDDVNKIIWSALGWDPEADVVEILRDYGRYFIGPDYADDFAQGLLALERNWRGPLISNQQVFITLKQFQDMERRASPQVQANWRFQQALYRAYYDAYVRSRLLYETALEQEALEKLRQAGRWGSLRALAEAEKVLARALTVPVGRDLRASVFELAEGLFQSVRMQLSVPRYKAIAVRRGANLDAIDTPLNNGEWLREKFTSIRKLPQEHERLQAIEEILNWANPGPGGFYDDLGNPSQQPHLVRGAGFEADPEFRQSSLVSFAVPMPAGWRSSWWRHGEALFDRALELRFEELDPHAAYRVRVVYAGERRPEQIRLVADDRYEIHPFRLKPFPPEPLEFDIPKAATEDSKLSLKWYRTPGLGGSGRGCQVSEVWLVRQPDGSNAQPSRSATLP